MLYGFITLSLLVVPYSVQYLADDVSPVMPSSCGESG